MRIKTIEMYQYDELSETAKEKAITCLIDINVIHDWWEFIYEDAKNIGLEITSFDLDRNRHVKGNLIFSAYDTAEKILVEHGNKTETYNTAKQYLQDFKNTKKDEDGDRDTKELDKDFLKSLVEDYSIILEKECEYLTSVEAVEETIRANEYEFTIDGEF